MAGLISLIDTPSVDAFFSLPFSSFRLSVVFSLVPHLIYLLRERIPDEAEQRAVT